MGEEKLKIGIIGTGNRGTYFGHSLSRLEDVEVSAICDPNPVRVQSFTENIAPVERCYSDPEEMCSKEKLDAAIITSPDRYHCDNAVVALKHGISVLIDKPLATTVADGQKILAAADKAGKTVMIGFNLRHNPVVKRLKQIIDGGTIGRVFFIENREFYNGGRTYMSRWNRKREHSGGLWIHKGSHDFDAFNWLLGFPRPVKVSATAGVAAFNPENIPFSVNPDVPVGPDCTSCHYRGLCPDVYEIDSSDTMWGKKAQKEDGYVKNLCMYLSDKDVHDNGIAFVEYANGVRASHFECFVTSFSDRSYTVVGDRGQAEVSTSQRTIVIRPRWSDEVITHQVPEVSGGHGGADPGLIGRFLEVIKGEEANTSTAEHGLLSTAIGQAAEISWRENRMVFIDELMKG